MPTQPLVVFIKHLKMKHWKSTLKEERVGPGPGSLFPSLLITSHLSTRKGPECYTMEELPANGRKYQQWERGVASNHKPSILSYLIPTTKQSIFIDCLLHVIHCFTCWDRELNKTDKAVYVWAYPHAATSPTSFNSSPIRSVFI